MFPPVYTSLSDDEWQLMDDWFTQTGESFENPGEMNVPPVSLVSGLIGGNGICATVQCGHYVGYSTLLLGFLLRSMGKSNALFSIDIDPEATAFTQKWVDKARLQDQVRLHVSDSADPELPKIAEEYFGRPVQLVFIDSSHQYQHTLKELDLWYDVLRSGGLILMHDVSFFAQSFDATDDGGVKRAVGEWVKANGVQPLLLNSHINGGDPDDLVYRDGCGLGIIQKQV